MIDNQQIHVTTDAGGNGHGWIGPMTGIVRRLDYTAFNYATTATFSIMIEGSRLPLWSESNVSASDWISPGRAAQSSSGADITNLYSDIPLSNERVYVNVTSGGAGKTGVFGVIVEAQEPVSVPVSGALRGVA